MNGRKTAHTSSQTASQERMHSEPARILELHLRCFHCPLCQLRRCQSQLLDTEAALSKLREQQRHAEERSSHGQAQRGMMNDLLQLLQLKQQIAAAAAAANSPRKAAGRDVLMSEGRWAPAGPAAANVMVL
jgi:hypothetical protein